MSNFEFVALNNLVQRVKVGFVGSIEKYYCDKEHGKLLLRTSNLSGGGIDFNDVKYVTEDFYKRNQKSQLKKYDLLIARHGDNGKADIYEADEPAQALNVVIIEPDFSKISPYLLRYFFELPYVHKQIKGDVGGSVQGVINTKQISDLIIPIDHSLNYSKIENTLRILEQKIDNNNKIICELEEMAKTIYDYWFLQFEFPNEEGKPYKSSGGKMIWNEEVKKEIPDGWKVGTLDWFIKKEKGGDWGKDKPVGNYKKRVICLRGTDFLAVYGRGKLEAPQRFILEKNMDKVLENGDLCIEISGGSPTQSTGRICYINKYTLRRFDEEAITSNFCKAISLWRDEYQIWFYVLWQKLYDSGIFFKYEGKTTGIKNLLFDIFCHDYKIIIPDDELIYEYNKKVEPFFNTIQENLLENQELTSLRDFLLPLLMNGQVSFKE